MGLIDNALAGLDDLQLGSVDRGGYLTDTDPSKLLDDPRFMRDLREYYAMNGMGNLSDMDLMREWYHDRTFAELNITRGITSDVYDTYNSSDKENALKGRLTQAYHRMPFFWQEGGFGERDSGQVARSISWAILTDPINLLGPAVAYRAAGQGAIKAAQLGKNIVWGGAKAGAAKAGAVEAAIAAPITGIADAALQGRDIQLGIQEEYDPLRTAGATAAGAVLGGGLGGVIGGTTGAVVARSSAQKIQKEILEQTYKARPGQFATPKDRIGWNIEQNEALLADELLTTENLQRHQIEANIDAENVPDAVFKPEGEDFVPSGLSPGDLNMRAIRENVETSRVALDEALQKNKLDQDDEIIKDLTDQFNEARTILNLGERIGAENERATIDSLLGSSEPTERARGERRSAALQRDINLYKRMINGDELSEPDVVRVKEILDEDEIVAPVPERTADLEPEPVAAKAAPEADETLIPLEEITIERATVTKEGAAPKIDKFDAVGLHAESTKKLESYQRLLECLRA